MKYINILVRFRKTMIKKYYWAIAVAAAHFLVLGLALEDAAALDGFLRWTELLVVKLAEWGLVLLLTVHLAAGLRLLVLELLPWRGARHGWIGWGAGAAFAIGLAFLWSVFGT